MSGVVVRFGVLNPENHHPVSSTATPPRRGIKSGGVSEDRLRRVDSRRNPPLVCDDVGFGGGVAVHFAHPILKGGRGDVD